MTIEVVGMMSAGIAAIAAGLFLVRPRLRAVSGAGRLIALGPLCEAAALAVFAAEHFTAARDLAPIVPRWLPAPLFWTYFFGAALLAAAISFIAWRQVRLSAPLLALFFFIIVATLDLPNLPAHIHERLFWTLTVRELSFGSGAIVLAAGVWAPSRPAAASLIPLARIVIGAIFIFYGIEHVLFPHFVPGVPLEKHMPAWMPAPVVLSGLIGITLLLAGPALFIPRTARIAAATSGTVLLLLTLFFYGPMMILEIRTPLAVEGLNYFFDTLLFAGTALLAGFSPELSIAFGTHACAHPAPDVIPDVTWASR